MKNLDQEKLTQQLAQGEINKVIKALFAAKNSALITKKNLKDDIIQISSRWNSLQSKIKNGTIASDDASVEENQIVEQVISLIEAIGVEGKPEGENESKKASFFQQIFSAVFSWVTSNLISSSIIGTIALGLIYLLLIRSASLPTVEGISFESEIEDDKAGWTNILNSKSKEVYLEKGEDLRLNFKFSLDNDAKGSIIKYRMLIDGQPLEEDYRQLDMDSLSGRHTFSKMPPKDFEIRLSYIIEKTSSVFKFLDNLLQTGNLDEQKSSNSIQVKYIPYETVEDMVFIHGGEYERTALPNCPNYNDKSSYINNLFVDINEVTYGDFIDGKDCPEIIDPATFPTVLGNSEFLPAIVSWKDAECYCESQGKRLPTIQEWRYIAAGGRFGAQKIGSKACAQDDPRKLRPAENLNKNGLGIRGLHCNAPEWTNTASISTADSAMVVGGESFAPFFTDLCEFRTYSKEGEFHYLVFDDEKIPLPIGFRCVKNVK